MSQVPRVTPNSSAIDLPANKRVQEKNGDPLGNPQASKGRKCTLEIPKNGIQIVEGRKPVPQAQSWVIKAKPRRSENDG